MEISQDDFWINHALDLARRAANEDEVPVGAVLVLDNQIVGEGYNQPIKTHDPSAHAEIIALRQAAKNIGNYRLINTTLYVTLEPCVMCAGALIHARVNRLVFGAGDKKAGAVSSIFNLLEHHALNHKISWRGGVREEDCIKVLQDFFKDKR